MTISSNSKLAALAAISTLSLASRVAVATCSDPASETEEASGSVTATALTPTGAHPILEQAIVASGGTLDFLATSDLSSDGTLGLPDTVQSTPNPVKLDGGSYAVFVARADGVISSVDPSTRMTNWSVDLTRSGCSNDQLQATPVVQLRRYASSSFKATYSDDLVYVATRYAADATCTSGHNTQNKIYALNASDGSVEWTFNGGATVDMDIVSESPFLVRDDDKLIVASERTFSSSQKSLWAIDILTGTAAWSANVGRVQTAPIVRDDKVYVGTVAGEIKSVELDDGTVNWTASGGVPITTNIFVEFRSPYDDLIAAVDLLGRVWVVRDDGSSSTSVWKVSLPSSKKAKSRPVIDAGNAKVFVGANDGQAYQLSLVDGSAEAERTIGGSSDTVGSASFVWEDTTGDSNLDDLRMIAGTLNGKVKKYCAPWSTESTYSPFAPMALASANAAPKPGPCKSASDCGDPGAGACYTWMCKVGVCVADPLPFEGKDCDDGNDSTTSDICHAGTCAGQTDCQRGPFDRCQCKDETGKDVNRRLLTTEDTTAFALACYSDPQCAAFVENLKDNPGTQVVNMRSSNSCVTVNTSVGSSLYIHLFDQNRIPFQGPNVEVQFTLVGDGDSGAQPQWLDATGKPVSGLSASTEAGTVFESSRAGTYFATLAAAPSGAATKQGPGWRVQLRARVTDGATCVDSDSETATNILVKLPATDSANQFDFGGCPISSNLDSAGFVRIRVIDEGGKPLEGARVQLGRGDNNAAFYSSFEKFITPSNPPGDTPNIQLTDSAGVVVFQDYGYNLNGGPRDPEAQPPAFVDGRLPIFIDGPGGKFEFVAISTEWSDVIVTLKAI